MTLAQLEPQMAELSWTEKAELMRRCSARSSILAWR